MRVVGIDLSGPANTADTALAVFEANRDGILLTATHDGATDSAILDLAQALGPPLVVGIDAPLAYQPGGGDRPAEKALRAAVVQAGLASGSVMTPTATRMAYLTLRGISVARGLQAVAPDIQIVEVHPGACMALRGAEPKLVRSFKSEISARAELCEWLKTQGVAGALASPGPSDHMIAAFAAALAAWRWAAGESVWLQIAEPPLFPFDFAC